MSLSLEDPAVGLFAFAFLLVGGFVFILMVVIPLFERRCPRCGKFLATITSSSEVADVTTTTFGYDDRTGTHREMKVRNRGFLVSYRCRGCENTWERLRSSARRVPLTATEEGERAMWKGPRTEEERRNNP